MILGIDTGMATCGWALLDEKTCSFIDLGVVITKKAKGEPVTIDRARRCNVQALELTQRMRGVSTVVVERMSFPPGGANAMVPIALSWGVVLGLIAMVEPRPELLTIAPQRWQREILPIKGAVDYDRLARRAAQFLLSRHPRAASALRRRIPRAHWSHAIDAAMIAVVAAVHREACERVA